MQVYTKPNKTKVTQENTKPLFLFYVRLSGSIQDEEGNLLTLKCLWRNKNLKRKEMFHNIAM
jgi:hypothetical protein